MRAEKRATQHGPAWFVRVDSLLPPAQPRRRPSDTFVQVSLLLGERIGALSERLDSVEAHLERLDNPGGARRRSNREHFRPLD